MVLFVVTSHSDTQGVRERTRVFETLNFFKRPDVAVLCAFSGNTIACSCSMSATGAPSKALKVRPPAAKDYQLRHCPLPNSLSWSVCCAGDCDHAVSSHGCKVSAVITSYHNGEIGMTRS